jgi:transposase-like protein
MRKQSPPPPQKKNGPPPVIRRAIAHSLDRGVSVEMLANKIDVHPTTLWRYVRGENSINSEAFLALCAAIDLTESDLKEFLASVKSG